ncbi:hypothetical protein H8F46_03950 [Xenorhabdus nematophila]|uniref:hypothetical protein n=1 Tax=Xenorhabdus nematophila TaxID=628 RepID=UPI00126A7526|nr:hypothetical protein [Xenorhabdus nematophila]QNJ37387.1 hypothetical protein H8F46_03950 [Xenorhabdus nematophila]
MWAGEQGVPVQRYDREIEETGTVIFAFLQLAGGKPFSARALRLILLPQLSPNLNPTWGQLALSSVQLAPFVVSGCWLVGGRFRFYQAA